MADTNDRNSAAIGDERQREGAGQGEDSSGGRLRGSGKSLRGFASMDPERQREIASRGGRAAHEKGTAHEWTSEEARRAGRKGGETVSRDRAHMAAIGREGGGARGARAKSAARDLNGAEDLGGAELEREVQP
jgi:general stress protein YciG